MCSLTRTNVYQLPRHQGIRGQGEVLTDPEHKRFLERTMRDYRRAGMHLPSDKRKRVEELRRKVKELETTYSQNLAEEKTTL